ncbi:MAG: type II toxin-antitoxin system HicB family antitoxin [Oscillospiraceae bacterium]|nr:type II toxin-antitoxin system HicB family antitoxin [Oscillospiraceae bacterium]
MYVYPVVFSPLDEEGYCVFAPDFKGCITEAVDYAEGIIKIRDGLCGMLYMLEQDKKPIPKPTDVFNVQHDQGEFVTLVDAPLDEYRRRVGSKAVRRTISIPEWLDELAVQSDVSLSQVTQEALRKRLSV